MINEIINMNGYGIYVWSSFVFTLLSFGFLFAIVKINLIREKKTFEENFKQLNEEKIASAKRQKTYREILVNTSASKV
tara:strand:+ start:1232 stop:1465 length:234 start_codon:yes stop_codon:yes gene_type:complete